MKTFRDLEFKPHALARAVSESGAEQAKIEFGETRLSVIRGSKHFYCGESTCEVGISRPGEEMEIREYQDADQITRLMKKLQEENNAKGT